jgi:hypothetical protein
MADEAPAPAGGAPAQGGGGGGRTTTQGGGEKPAQNDSKTGLHESVRQMRNGTFKPTVTKSAFDAHVSGIVTPMSRPASRQNIGLDDYFVS